MENRSDSPAGCRNPDTAFTVSREHLTQVKPGHSVLPRLAQRRWWLKLPAEATIDAAVMVASGSKDDLAVRWLSVLALGSLAFHARKWVGEWPAALIPWIPQFAVVPEGGALSGYNDVLLGAFAALSGRLIERAAWPEAATAWRSAASSGPASADAVALWHAAGLTRPWNDPEEDLRRAKEAAEAANRAKDHFLAVLSRMADGATPAEAPPGRRARSRWRPGWAGRAARPTLPAPAQSSEGPTDRRPP